MAFRSMLEEGYTLDQVTNVIDKFNVFEIEAMKPLIKRGIRSTYNIIWSRGQTRFMIFSISLEYS